MMVIKNHRRGRSMFFMCFRPPSADSAAVVDRPVKLVLSSSEDESGRRRKKKGRQSLAGAFKAVFFQTSLTKKFGSESSSRSSFRSSSNLSSKHEKVTNSMKKAESYKELSDPEERNSSRSSLFSSTSSNITSSSSSSSSVLERKRSSSLDLRQSNTNKKSKKREVDKSWNSNPTIGMCTILGCLVALILCGKVVAILICTTMWVFFVPRRVNLSQNDVDLEVDSEEYKKRVIMEGLLERNNRPRIV